MATAALDRFERASDFLPDPNDVGLGDDPSEDQRVIEVKGDSEVEAFMIERLAAGESVTPKWRAKIITSADQKVMAVRKHEATAM